MSRSHPFPAVRVGEMIKLAESGTWFDILERVHDTEPGHWERICDHCGGLVADWDVVCRHCAWTLNENGQDAAAGDSDGEPPPDVNTWRDQVGQQARRAGSWRPGRRPKDGAADDDAETPDDIHS